MNESQHRYWDTVIKSVTVVVVVFGGVWAFYKYFDTEQRKINITFWNKRLELYVETSNVASSIANAKTESEAKDKIDEFRRLYNGPMSLIETNSVKKAMQEFSGLVSQFEGNIDDFGGTVKPEIPVDERMRPEELRTKLQDGANDLANVMRISLKESWNRPFEFDLRDE